MEIIDKSIKTIAEEISDLQIGLVSYWIWKKALERDGDEREIGGSERLFAFVLLSMMRFKKNDGERKRRVIKFVKVWEKGDERNGLRIQVVDRGDKRIPILANDYNDTENAINELLEAKSIEPSTSPFCSHTFMLKKKVAFSGGYALGMARVRPAVPGYIWALPEKYLDVLGYCWTYPERTPTFRTNTG
ncbi:hypothetical protein KI387_008311, partial [Taxus chinensis]